MGPLRSRTIQLAKRLTVDCVKAKSLRRTQKSCLRCGESFRSSLAKWRYFTRMHRHFQHVLESISWIEK